MVWQGYQFIMDKLEKGFIKPNVKTKIIKQTENTFLSKKLGLKNQLSANDAIRVLIKAVKKILLVEDFEKANHIGRLAGFY